MFIVNFIRKSLQLELYDFADFFDVPNVTKQAFSKARKKLSPKVFTILNEKLIEEFYSDNAIKTFKGLRVLAIDSSNLRLPLDSVLYEQYGGSPANTNLPLARISIMFDVLNQITLHGVIEDYRASERYMAVEHIAQLPKKRASDLFEDLLVFDRGYPSLGLIFMLHEQKNHFLMRINEDFLLETNAAIKNECDSIVTIHGRRHNISAQRHGANAGKDSQLQSRCLVFDLGNGKKEVVLTSLMDKDRFIYDDIFNLYRMRWAVEEGYKFYKNIAEIENFSGKSKIAIEQDFYATIFACNMSALLMLEAQDEVEQEQSKKSLKYRYKINRNILIGTMKNEIISVLMGNQDLNEYCERLKIRLKKNLVPIRPGRSFPRIFKRTRLRGSVDRRSL